MNRFPRWRPRLALLVGICAASGAGIAAPSRYTDPVRTVVADGLRPGREAAMAVADRVQSMLSRFRTPAEDGDLTALQAEVAVLRARSQQQQAEQVALIQRTSAEFADTGAPSAAAHHPLLTTDLVPAAVLGRQPDVLRARFARILGRGTTSQIAVEDLVLADAPHLDQGTESEVQDRQPVLAGRVVVGCIGKAGRWTSTLQLVTDPAYRANVQLVRESRAGPVLGAAGVLRGNDGKTCVLEYIPGHAAVSVGDYVYSRQQDSDQPAPLYYGRVVAADVAAGADDWTIQVEPAFDPAALQSVQILTVSLNPQRIGLEQVPAAEEPESPAALFSPPADGAGQP